MNFTSIQNKQSCFLFANLFSGWHFRQCFKVFRFNLITNSWIWNHADLHVCVFVYVIRTHARLNYFSCCDKVKNGWELFSNTSVRTQGNKKKKWWMAVGMGKWFFQDLIYGSAYLLRSAHCNGAKIWAKSMLLTPWIRP